MKRVILSLLAAIMLTSVGIAGNPGKPAPKHLKIIKPIVKPVMAAHLGLKTYLIDDAVVMMPVPQVTVQTNVLGAPGSTGSYMCYGTYVTVTQVNECGQTEILQQYWVQSSIICYPVVN